MRKQSEHLINRAPKRNASGGNYPSRSHQLQTAGPPRRSAGRDALRRPSLARRSQPRSPARGESRGYLREMPSLRSIFLLRAFPKPVLANISFSIEKSQANETQGCFSAPGPGILLHAWIPPIWLLPSTVQSVSQSVSAQRSGKATAQNNKEDSSDERFSPKCLS